MELDLSKFKHTSPLKPAHRVLTRRISKKLPWGIRSGTKKSDSLYLKKTMLHLNTMAGHSSIPHKYDHFHEKTYINPSLVCTRESPLVNIIENHNLERAHFFFSRQKAILKSLDRYKHINYKRY